MYRNIDFETKVFDEFNREYFKPPSHAIAEKLNRLEFDGFRIKTKLDFNTVYVYCIPIYQEGSLFRAEKTGLQRLLGKFYYDDDTGKITLYVENIFNIGFSRIEVPIPELLFSCLRPVDMVEVICPIKYSALKSDLMGLGEIIKVENLGKFRIFKKSDFAKIQEMTVSNGEK